MCHQGVVYFDRLVSFAVVSLTGTRTAQHCANDRHELIERLRERIFAFAHLVRERLGG